MSDYFVHESSYVDDGATVGKGTKIWHFCHLMADSVVGEECSLGQNVVISPGVTIGDRVKIQNNVSVYTGVTVEKGAFLGPSCVFTNVINPRSLIERKDEYRPTRVGFSASIGANATIICGNHIGDYALVGAGAVVTRDVPAYGLVVGNPARLVGHVCRCGVTLPPFDTLNHATCTACERAYWKDAQGEVHLVTNDGKEG